MGKWVKWLPDDSKHIETFYFLSENEIWGNLIRKVVCRNAFCAIKTCGAVILLWHVCCQLCYVMLTIPTISIPFQGMPSMLPLNRRRNWSFHMSANIVLSVNFLLDQCVWRTMTQSFWKLQKTSAYRSVPCFHVLFLGNHTLFKLAAVGSCFHQEPNASSFEVPRFHLPIFVLNLLPGMLP